MHFELVQHYDAPIDDVAGAFCDPDLFEQLHDLPNVGTPEVLSCERHGYAVRLEVRYHFTGALSPDARSVIDPTELTWVEVSHHDLRAHHVTYVLTPDHYVDRFTCMGAHWFTPEPGHTSVTLRHSDGNVKAKIPLVGDAVERALVSGLREHLQAELPVVGRFLAQRRLAEVDD